MKIAILAQWFIPGRKAGGPIPGILGVIASINRTNELHIFAGNRDLGELNPYTPPFVGHFKGENYQTYYLNGFFGKFGLSWALAELHKYDFVYLNSIFSKKFGIAPFMYLWLTRYKGQIVISPRGELAPSALSLGGRLLKRVWLFLFTMLGLSTGVGNAGNVTWLASSGIERRDIEVNFPKSKVIVAAERIQKLEVIRNPRLKGSSISAISVGRISPVKGTLELINALGEVKSKMELRLIGPIDDQQYWEMVKTKIDSLSKKINVVFLGILNADELSKELGHADFFISLTKGENFGHAIGEALSSGCPAIISDQTPWTDIQDAGAGKVIPIRDCDDPRRVAQVIDSFIESLESQPESMGESAKDFAKKFGAGDTILINQIFSKP